MELIVVDDASESPAEDALAGIDDRRLRAVRLERSAGVAGARNAGLAQARGDWIAFLDDDDRWVPRKLREQLDQAERKGARWAWSAAVVTDADGNQLHVDPVIPPEEIGTTLRLYNAIPGSASSVIVETELVRALGGFDESFIHLADWDLWLRLAEAAPGAASPEPLVMQRIHSGGMHSRDARGAIDEFAELRRKHPDLQAREFVRWAAAAEWRRGRRLAAIRDYVGGRIRYR